MVGEIVHIELPSRDFVRSAAFYAKVFGWKTDGLQSGGHLGFEPTGGVQGSWVRDALAQAPGPVPFVAVADVEKTLAVAVEQGGRILVRNLTLPHHGRFGLFADCDGNVIGVLADRTAATTRSPAAAKVDRDADPDRKSVSPSARKVMGGDATPPAAIKAAAPTGKAVTSSASKKSPPRKTKSKR